MSICHQVKLMFGVRLEAHEYIHNLDNAIMYVTSIDPIIAEDAEYYYIGHLVDSFDIGSPDDGVGEMPVSKSEYEEELKAVFKDYDLEPTYMIVGYSI